MNNKIKIVALAAILLCGASVMLTSCSNDDDLSGEQTSQAEAQQKADVKASLLGLQVDLSDILIGGDDIYLWMFKDDGTFEVLNMSMVAREDEEDSLAMNSYEGKWDVFVNADNPWGTSSEKLNGFTARLTMDDNDMTDEEFAMTYYVETAEDENGEPVLIMLNGVSIDYQMMMAYEGDDDAMSRTRGFTNDVFKKKQGQIVNAVTQTKKAFGSTIGTISASNKLSSLSEKECQTFFNEAEDALNTMLSDFNVSQTNYAEWMTEIYTKKGKNPRICDMNIPGSHDTFTYYYYKHTHTFSRWVCTQVEPISGQWEAGGRVFNFRLAYDKDKNPDCMGLYLTKYLYINFEKALQEIVDQLDKHPGETAIASLAFDGDKGDNYISLTQATLKKFADKGKIVLKPTPDVRLNDCKGKIIVMYTYEFGDKRDELYGPLLYIGSGNQYSKSMLAFPKDGKTMDATMTYQNLYEMTSSFRSNSEFYQHKKEAFETCFWEFQKFRAQEATVWSWNQLNAYIGNYVTMSYSQNAEVIHPWAVNFVLQHKNSPFGIITMDFIGSDDYWEGYSTNCEALHKIIIETNRYQ